MIVTNLQGICDGAGAVVIASEEAITKYNLTPLAKLVDYSVAGVDPTIMGIGPVYAIRDLLKKVKLKLDDIDLVEVRMIVGDCLDVNVCSDIMTRSMRPLLLNF